MSNNDLYRGFDENSENIYKVRNKNNQFLIIESALAEAHRSMLNLNAELKLLKENSSEKVTEFKELYTNEFLSFRQYIESLAESNDTKIEYFERKLNQYIEEKNNNELILNAKKRKAAERISYISNLQGEYAWTHIESFAGLAAIETVIDNPVNINVESEQVTLPINNTSTINIKEFMIGADSNCIIGAPEGGHNNINSLRFENDFFSVYKVSNTKCLLELEVVLGQETVINQIFLSFPATSYSPVKEIKDIIFCDSSYNEVSIKDIGKQILKVNSSKRFESYFLPIEAKVIKIFFEQPESYSYNNQLINRIDISEVKVYRNEFAEEGSLESKNISFGNFYTARINRNIFPVKTESFEEKYFIKNTEVKPEEVYLLPEVSNSISYKAVLKRNQSLNILLSSDDFFNYETTIRYIDPNIPYLTFLENVRNAENILACQVIEGFLKNPENLELPKNLQMIPDLKINYTVGRNLSSVENVTNIVVEDEGRVKILSGEYAAKVSEVEDYYDFEVGPFLELDSLKIFRSTQEEECNFLFSLEDGKIKTASVRKTELVLEPIIKELSSLPKFYNTYETGKGLVKNSLQLLEGLNDTWEEISFINGSEEFMAIESRTDYIPGQDISNNNIISFELEEIAYRELGGVKIYKDGIEKFSVTFGENIVPEDLNPDEPVIDSNTNVLYLKSSDVVYFKGYSLRYKFLVTQELAQYYYSVNYETGVIHFNKYVDPTSKISFKSAEGILLKFKLAEYLNVTKDENNISIYGDAAYSNLNRNIGHIYIAEAKEIFSLENKEKYFSPILNSIEVNAT